MGPAKLSARLVSWVQQCSFEPPLVTDSTQSIQDTAGASAVGRTICLEISLVQVKLAC